MSKSRDFLALLGRNNREVVTSSLSPAATAWPTKGKHASVLVPLHFHEGQPSVLFTVRSSKLNRYRSQVSFPGGLADVGDKNMAHTALRETEEELGIPRSQVDVWGALPSLPDRFGRVITPIIGSVGVLNPKHLPINTAEVSSVFSLSIEHLTSPDNHGHTYFKPFPLYFPVFLGGSRRIWGITALILDITLQYILPPQLNYQTLIRTI